MRIICSQQTDVGNTRAMMKGWVQEILAYFFGAICWRGIAFDHLAEPSLEKRHPRTSYSLVISCKRRVDLCQTQGS